MHFFKLSQCRGFILFSPGVSKQHNQFNHLLKGVNHIMGRLLWIIIVALIVFWVLGLVFKIGGGLIHILLVIALIVFILNLITGRRGV